MYDEEVLNDFMKNQGLQNLGRAPKTFEILLGFEPDVPTPKGLLDHVWSFCWPGDPEMQPQVLVSQSYKELTQEFKDAVEIWAELYSLDVEFNTHESWWNPGRCAVIVFRRTGLTPPYVYAKEPKPIWA